MQVLILAVDLSRRFESLTKDKSMCRIQTNETFVKKKNTFFYRNLHKILLKLKIKAVEQILNLNRFQKNFIKNFLIKLSHFLHQKQELNKDSSAIKSTEFAFMHSNKLFPLKKSELEGYKFSVSKNENLETFHLLEKDHILKN